MAFLIDIKKKIVSVQGTRKITQAMELVAASRMKAFQRKALATRAYAKALVGGLDEARASLGELALSEKRVKGKTLFVIVTSDKGLCGSLNQQLIRTLLREPRWNELPPENKLLITIGRKSHDAMAARGIPVAKRFEGLKEDMRPLDALVIVQEIVSRWMSGEIKEVLFVQPLYVNAFTTHVRVKSYLPFGEVLNQESRITKHDSRLMIRDSAPEPLFEPDREELIDKLAAQLLESLFTEAFFELKACEYSSRMVAMKHASEAAGDMIKALTLEYNKARQAAITQQLAELAGAGAAMGA
jgi:F-type H+-transporting ATPase subunit gamma